MEKKYKYLGTNDDESTCCCCNRAGLKKVVWLRDIDTGLTLWYGTTCAMKLLGIKQKTNMDGYTKKELAETTKQIKKEIIESEENKNFIYFLTAFSDNIGALISAENYEKALKFHKNAFGMRKDTILKKYGMKISVI